MNSPVFIIGMERSGTTLLYESLSNHPDLIYITERENLNYLNQYRKKLFLSRFRRYIDNTDESFLEKPSEANGLYLLAGLPYYYRLTSLDVLPYYRRFFINEIKPRVRTFLNKNPHNCYRVKFLREIFPDSKFIHIYRKENPCVLANIEHRKNKNFKWKEVRKFINSIIPINRFGDKNNQYEIISKERFCMMLCANEIDNYTLRYEDFISCPDRYLKDICDYIGIPFSEKIIPEYIYDGNKEYENKII